MSKTQIENNNRIREKLYKEGLIDRISNKGYLDYSEFKNIKADNSLNLGRVNELHSEIKEFIYKDRTDVSTKYLGDYIGFFSFIHNWRIDNEHFPSSHSDAEKIFIEILRHQISYTTNDLKATTVNLPKPTSRYITLLKEKTKEARKVLKNKYFKFDEEDNVIDFDKRKFLSDQPKSKLQQICKENGIKNYRKWTTWSIITCIMKLSNIGEIILQLIKQNRYYDIAYEDEQYNKVRKYAEAMGLHS